LFQPGVVILIASASGKSSMAPVTILAAMIEGCSSLRTIGADVFILSAQARLDLVGLRHPVSICEGSSEPSSLRFNLPEEIARLTCFSLQPD